MRWYSSVMSYKKIQSKTDNPFQNPSFSSRWSNIAQQLYTFVWIFLLDPISEYTFIKLSMLLNKVVMSIIVIFLLFHISISIHKFYNSDANLPVAVPFSDVTLTTDWNDRADDLLQVIVIMPSVSSTSNNSGQLITEPA